MINITQTLFSGWNFMRWLRLAFGVFFLVQSIQTKDAFIGIAGGFFLLTALTNTACCGTKSCAAPIKRNKESESEEIKFEEVN